MFKEAGRGYNHPTLPERRSSNSVKFWRTHLLITYQSYLVTVFAAFGVDPPKATPELIFTIAARQGAAITK